MCLTEAGFPGVTVVKNQSAVKEKWVPSLGWEDPLEEEMATHSSIYSCLGNSTDRGAGGLSFTGLQRVGHY